MTTLRQAAEQAVKDLEEAADDVADWGAYASEYFQKKWNLQADIEKYKTKAEALRQALAEPEQNCKTHPDAPHGFCRNASLSEDRYVCECEYWEPPQHQWVEMTDDEIIKWVETDEYSAITNDWASHIAFARAVEAKLKEKNYDRT